MDGLASIEQFDDSCMGAFIVCQTMDDDGSRNRGSNREINLSNG